MLIKYKINNKSPKRAQKIIVMETPGIKPFYSKDIKSPNCQEIYAKNVGLFTFLLKSYSQTKCQVTDNMEELSKNP
jgi:hypothetical protein